MLRHISLSGRWKFVLDLQNRGLAWGKYQKRNPAGIYPEGAGDLHSHFDDLLLDEVNVPGNWQKYRPEYKYYEGAAFFIRYFDRPALAEGERVFLHLEGVSYRARIFLNDHEVGSLNYPYLPANIEITSCLLDINYLVIRVEGASRPEDSLPQFGWDNCAGLIRPVSLQITGRKRFDLVLVDTINDFTAKQGQIKLRATAKFSQNDILAWKITGENTDFSGTIDLDDNYTCEWISPALMVKFWTPEVPVLYDFELTWQDKAGKILDVFQTKIGFREFIAQAGKFMLNGKNIFIRGISRHHLHPDYGMTMPESVMLDDLRLVKELGCNFIRLPHYPQNTEVLDACDKLGLLVWVEIPFYWDATLANPVTREQIYGQLEAMVRRDYNHPAVAIWSMANEINSEKPEALECLQYCREIIQRYDSVRPVTFASWPRHASNNLGLQAVDICCLNRYRGWYDPNPELIAGELDSMRNLYPDKPVLLTEFGAGAEPGRYSQKLEKWSEDYQAELLANIVRQARSHANGCIIWVLADFNDPSRVSQKVSHGYINNKGLLSDDRKHRKLSFERIKTIYNQWKLADEKEFV